MERSVGCCTDRGNQTKTYGAASPRVVGSRREEPPRTHAADLAAGQCDLYSARGARELRAFSRETHGEEAVQAVGG